jgi:hypothetical protein
MRRPRGKRGPDAQPGLPPGVRGCGTYDEETGLYEWYEGAEGFGGDGPTWPNILRAWNLVEADLHDVYQIDVEEPGLLASRSWRWLRVRIIGLLTTESRLKRHFAPPADDKQ